MITNAKQTLHCHHTGCGCIVEANLYLDRQIHCLMIVYDGIFLKHLKHTQQNAVTFIRVVTEVIFYEAQTISDAFIIFCALLIPITVSRSHMECLKGNWNSLRHT